jgi:hypothetical protein
MPWTSRPQSKRSGRRLRRGLRRWRYDNSEGMISFWIGALVVAVGAVAAVVLAKLV